MTLWVDRLSKRYLIYLSVVVLIVLSGAIYVNAYGSTPPSISTDTSFYQHSGWYILEHNVRPYVNIWSVKPPLHFVLQTVLATVADGNMLLLHWLNIILSSLSVLITVLFSAMLVKNITGSNLAGLATGLTILCLPDVLLYASEGFRSKLYVMVFGIVSLWLQERQKPFFSGFSAMFAVGFWQFGIIFPVMSVLMALSLGEKKSVPGTILGALASGILILVPVFVWGAFSAMIVEALIVPAIMTESMTPLLRLSQLVLWADVAIVPLGVGLVGLVVYIFKRSNFSDLWLGMGFILVLIQVICVDLDGVSDSFLLLIFCALGMGFITSYFEKKQRAYVTLLITLYLCLTVGLHLNILKYHSYSPTRLLVNKLWLTAQYRDQHPKNNVRQLPIQKTWNIDNFWDKSIPNGCHYRLSVDEREWMMMTNQSTQEPICGRFESIQKAWNRSTDNRDSSKARF